LVSVLRIPNVGDGIGLCEGCLFKYLIWTIVLFLPFLWKGNSIYIAICLKSVAIIFLLKHPFGKCVHVVDKKEFDSSKCLGLPKRFLQYTQTSLYPGMVVGDLCLSLYFVGGGKLHHGKDLYFFWLAKNEKFFSSIVLKNLGNCHLHYIGRSYLQMGWLSKVHLLSSFFCNLEHTMTWKQCYIKMVLGFPSTFHGDDGIFKIIFGNLKFHSNLIYHSNYNFKSLKEEPVRWWCSKQ
jgi:hypothetical protein